jgi:threonine/homoserine/homoserine lactone efflux protein
MGAAYGFRPGLAFVIGLCLGQLVVIALVVTGLAALVLAQPWMRAVLLLASTGYLLYLAAKIAFAGATIQFTQATRPPGVMSGFLLQPINPKAYVVNTALFSGFALYPEAYWLEVGVKLVLLNAIWFPIHLAWLWAGVALERLKLAPRLQRRINLAMAAAMLAVVALAVWSTLRG